jgi:hypothetical protein
MRRTRTRRTRNMRNMRKTRKKGSGFMRLFRRTPNQRRIYVAPIQQQQQSSRVLPTVEEIQQRHNIYIEPKDLEGQPIEDANAEIFSVPKGVYDKHKEAYELEVFTPAPNALALKMLDVYNPEPIVLTKKQGGKRTRRQRRKR